MGIIIFSLSISLMWCLYFWHDYKLDNYNNVFFDDFFGVGVIGGILLFVVSIALCFVASGALALI